MTECPTCRTPRDEDGRWQHGQFRISGALFPCDCARQVELLEHYLLAGIPKQYMRLSWDRDFTGDPNAKEAVANYLEKWDGMREYGIGMEFAGTLGIGKTFAATAIAKELVKRNEDVMFVQFVEVLEGIRYERLDLIERVKSTKVLVLDEIVSPPNEKLQSVFANQFEHIIRRRTNDDAVTIMTTNLSEHEIEAHYERVYSLMQAKQIRVNLTGTDARRGVAGTRNLELAINGEVAPIT